MSDVQQGPDWLLGPDSKWHPPESRLAQPAPNGLAVQLPTPTFSIAYAPPGPGLSSALTGWLVALFWLTAASATAAAAYNFFALREFKGFRRIDSGQNPAHWLHIDEIAFQLNRVFVLVWIVTFIVLVIWINRAHKAT